MKVLYFLSAFALCSGSVDLLGAAAGKSEDPRPCTPEQQRVPFFPKTLSSNDQDEELRRLSAELRAARNLARRMAAMAEASRV